MVTKGLDFENVTLVGVLSADVLLNLPDFQSGERAFQILTQWQVVQVVGTIQARSLFKLILRSTMLYKQHVNTITQAL